MGRNEELGIPTDDIDSSSSTLADCLDILGSDVRLPILKLLQLNVEGLDVHSIKKELSKSYGKGMVRENTEKHIKKLMEIGVVKKEPGIREMDNRPVINYVLVPGKMEAIIRLLNRELGLKLNFATIENLFDKQKQLSEELLKKYAVIKVLGGAQDSKIFVLTKEEVKLGRIGGERGKEYDENDIVLSDEYGAVSRVWKPHAKFIRDGDQWYIVHCKGTHGTFLNNIDIPLVENERKELTDGDMIHLGRGERGALIVFSFKGKK